MNGSATIRLAGAVAGIAAIAALAAPTALADPPNYPRHVPRAQVGLNHEPEIVSGLAPSPEGRLAPRPEIIGGVASSGDRVLVSRLTQPSALASHGFDWTDAGIGAGVALAGVALASGCALALRKRVSLAH
jgi:hypothetical protein